MAKNTYHSEFEFPPMADFSKWAEQFKVPGLDMTRVLESQRRNLEAISQANRVTMEGAQAIARRQMEILRQSMEEASKVMQGMAAAGTTEERMARQAEVMKEAFETAIANIRELAEMGAKSNSEAVELINRRVSESLDEIRDVVRKNAEVPPAPVKPGRARS